MHFAFISSSELYHEILIICPAAVNAKGSLSPVPAFTVCIFFLLISQLAPRGIHSPQNCERERKKGKSDQFFLSFVTVSNPNVCPCPPDAEVLFQAKPFSLSLASNPFHSEATPNGDTSLHTFQGSDKLCGERRH